MTTEKISEFRGFIQAFVDANGDQTFGKRIHWKTFPEKIVTNAIKGLKIPDNETIMMILDASLTGSGKEGIALTDWGLRYNDGVDSWQLSWNDFSEKYNIVKIKTDGALGMKIDELLLKSNSVDDFAVNKKISISMASIDYNILARILNKTCSIFTGKRPDMTDSTVNETQSPQSEVNRQVKTLSETNVAPEKQIPAQEAEREPLKKQEDSIIEKASDFIEDRMSGKTGSFLSENIGALIAATIMSILFILGGVWYAILLAFPLSFIGYLLGNKLRLALHPDFVIADGFMGLLKEQIFWRWGPQLIGTLIGGLIGGGIMMGIFG